MGVGGRELKQRQTAGMEVMEVGVEVGMEVGCQWRWRWGWRWG